MSKQEPTFVFKGRRTGMSFMDAARKPETLARVAEVKAQASAANLFSRLGGLRGLGFGLAIGTEDQCRQHERSAAQEETP